MKDIESVLSFVVEIEKLKNMVVAVNKRIEKGSKDLWKVIEQKLDEVELKGLLK